MTDDEAYLANNPVREAAAKLASLVGRGQRTFKATTATVHAPTESGVTQ